MNEAAQTRIKQLIKEGKQYDEIRNTLMSEGHDMTGFGDDYAAVQRQLGAGELHPEGSTSDTSPEEQGTGDAFASEDHGLDVSVVVRNVFKILAGVLVIVAAVILLSGYGERLVASLFGDSAAEMEGLTAQDLSREANAKSFQVSARAYKSRLLNYDGMCSDIGIDRDTYNCYEDGDSYAIETPLSDGRFYCVDSTEFAGVVENSTNGRTSCMQ